jgi:hypothetical protein
MAATTDDDLLTLGQVSRALACPEWKLRAALKRRLAPEPQRLGCMRAFRRAQLPALAEALRLCGYLPADGKAT